MLVFVCLVVLKQLFSLQARHKVKPNLSCLEMQKNFDANN